MSPSRAPAVWRRAITVLTGCMLAAGLTGCAGAAPELEINAAAKFQQQVLEVTRSAAGSNPAAALKSLDRLSSELDAAAAAGQVSFKRHRSITAAIKSVRADLTAAQAQAARKAAAEVAAQPAAARPTAAPKPSPTAAPAVVVPAPAPAPVPAPASNGRQDNSGKGNSEGNKDKGSGKKKD
ncbi:mucin-associated surface protein [Arthrobacter sp. IA7]|uniref:mucin-associated surface protein n=1 Tax=Arthrobacter ipis TaxID=2716202 RepID=UPI001684D80B|nr:mucin-associated surface protein [Arthrobacter ipis]MBD1543223.1 mucin-associated surface protein [Arthrobacter ipis]